ncbi:hypothetical protein LDENG_00089150 [Lucifuga dentata]|nr:hypothetical protein LDENG_00089150 [Lucifuga dentata]
MVVRRSAAEKVELKLRLTVLQRTTKLEDQVIKKTDSLAFRWQTLQSPLKAVPVMSYPNSATAMLEVLLTSTFPCSLMMTPCRYQGEVQHMKMTVVAHREFMTSENDQEKHLSPAHCSVIAYMYLVSEKVLDELKLKEYKTSWEGCRRLLPLLRCCRKALLDQCRLTDECCESVAAALQADNTHLMELDLSFNDLTDDAVKLLKTGLLSPHCKLHTLRMNNCYLTEKCCEALASVFAEHLQPSSLRELDLIDNDLQDAGVKLLSVGVGNPACKLETLRLSFCGITTEGGVSLAAALISNPTHLKELDLSYNHLGDSGVSQLSSRLQDPSCRLERLNKEHGAECWLKSGLKKYACKLTLDPNTAYETLNLEVESLRGTMM